MRGVTEARGLGDLRTAISHRLRANPRQKGSTHLEMYLLDKERQRLEVELSRLDHRRARINERLGEIARGLEGLDATAKRDAASGTNAAGGSAAALPHAGMPGTGESGTGKWKQIPVDY